MKRNSFKVSMSTVLLLILLVLTFDIQCYASDTISLSKYGIKSINIKNNCVYVSEDEAYNEDVLFENEDGLIQLRQYMKQNQFVFEYLDPSIPCELAVVWTDGDFPPLTEYIANNQINLFLVQYQLTFSNELKNKAANSEVKWCKLVSSNGIDYIATKYNVSDGNQTQYVLQYHLYSPGNNIIYRAFFYEDLSDEKIQGVVDDFTGSITYNDEVIDAINKPSNASTASSNTTEDSSTDDTKKTNTTTTYSSNSYSYPKKSSAGSNILAKAIGGGLAGGLFYLLSKIFKKKD